MTSCSVPSDLLTLLSTIFVSQCIPDTSTFLPVNYAPNLKNNDTFDFIIVGGGSAGCVLANRLSENPNWRVLLMEAGTYPSKLSEIPYLYIGMFLSNETWKYRNAASSKVCLGFKENRCVSTYAKMLGGNSYIDFLTHNVGPESDYDNWSELGNPGWEWKNVSGFYEKSKQYYLPEKVETLNYFRTVRKAYEELGYPYNVKNKGNYISDEMLYVKNGKQFSVAKAYLTPVKERKNLFVALNSHVTKLIINKIVDGVEVLINENTKINIKASKEVILSAGPANSAKLLMLSGVGPKDELRKNKIPLIKELPVGKNLQDHFGLGGVFMRVDENSDFTQESLTSPASIKQYFHNFTGPLSATAMHFFPYLSTKNESNPNFYITLVSFAKNDSLLPLLLNIMRFNEISIGSILKFSRENHLVFCTVTLVEPRSRGTVKLQSSNPLHDPIIDNNYLGNEEDVEEFLKAIDSFKSVLKTKPMRDVHAEIIDFEIPNCKEKFDTREYWICNLRNFGTSIYLPGGTCKMGPSTDPTTVVSPTLNVHGIQNLRVVDTSVMPVLSRANSNLPEVLIAEKASDMIKNCY